MLNSISSPSKESIFYKIPTIIGDLAVQFLVLWFLVWHTGMVRDANMPIYSKSGTFLILAISYFLTVALIGIKIGDRKHSAVSIMGRGILNAFLTWVFFNGLMAIIYELTLQGKLLLLQLVLTIAGVVLWHMAVRFGVSRVRKMGHNTYSLLMIGTDENMVSIFKTYSKPIGSKGYNIFGFFTDDESAVPAESHYLGPLSDALAYINDNAINIKEVYCSISPASHKDYVDSLIAACEAHMIRFKFVPSLEGYPRHQMQFTQVGNVNVVSLHDEPLNSMTAKVVKRAFDIFISGLFLITLYPFIWIVCAIGIKISSPHGPILFRQKRTGYEGKEFDCLKFRSMHPSADADTKQAVKNDSRVFRFGEFIRKTSIDELPQFINVFKGDMSIIGPRPHMLHHTEVYSALIGDYMVRHLAKPGITGWAQVNGCRGETKELEDMKERVEKDIFYIEHWSVDLDLSIFFITIWQTLFHRDEKAY